MLRQGKIGFFVLSCKIEMKNGEENAFLSRTGFVHTIPPTIHLNSSNYSPNKKEFEFSLFYHACPGRPGKYGVR